MRGLVDHLRRKLAAAEPQPPDPFRTWELQARLSRLSAEIAAMDQEPVARFALRHHALAAMKAYDRTLAEACALAGLPISTVEGRAERLIAEAQLSQAGWSW